MVTFCGPVYSRSRQQFLFFKPTEWLINSPVTDCLLISDKFVDVLSMDNFDIQTQIYAISSNQKRV